MPPVWLRNTGLDLPGLTRRMCNEEGTNGVVKALHHHDIQYQIDDPLLSESEWSDVLKDGFKYYGGPGTRRSITSDVSNASKQVNKYRQSTKLNSNSLNYELSNKMQHSKHSIDKDLIDSPLRPGLVIFNRDPRNNPVTHGTQ